MTNLKHLRERIKSVRSTQKITKAMQIVSATKLKKLRDVALKPNYYIDTLSEMLSTTLRIYNQEELPVKVQKFFCERSAGVTSSNDPENGVVSDEGRACKGYKKKPHLLIALTSERGLCGGFNSHLVKKVKADIELLEQGGNEVKLIIVGKKGYDLMKKTNSKNIVSCLNISKDNQEIISLNIKQSIMEMVDKDEIGTCFLYFNQFKNALVQVSTKRQLLPLNFLETEDSSKGSLNVPDYEGKGLILNMIELYLSGQINNSLLQNNASEQGARMTAMDNATKNANDLIDKLQLKLNQTRQAAITTELIEIISGSEAVT